jgi:hypothetical protein
VDETDATVLSDDDNDIPIEKLEDECSVFGNATIIPPRKFRSDVKPKQKGSVNRKLKVRKFERMQHGFCDWFFFKFQIPVAEEDPKKEYMCDICGATMQSRNVIK